jgi:hypothetical protein
VIATDDEAEISYLFLQAILSTAEEVFAELDARMSTLRAIEKLNI